MKNALLSMPLIAAGILAAGCAASTSTVTTPAAPPSSVTASASSAAASASVPAASSSAAAPSVSASTAVTGTAASGTPTCTSADLQGSVGGGPGSGMSQNHTGLQLRNIGSAACTLYGYPGVSWVAGADGHQVGAAATRQADPTGAAELTVTLAPGAVASAPLDLVDAGAIPPAACKPVPVRGLRVYPPGQRAALFIPLATDGGYGECSLATTNPTLFIGWVQAGVQPGGDGQG